MFRWLFARLGFVPCSPVSEEEVRREISRIGEERGRDVAQRFTRQVSVAQGQFVTAREIDGAFGLAPWRS